MKSIFLSITLAFYFFMAVSSRCGEVDRSQKPTPEFNCQPSRFALGDEITITLPKDHPKNWAIVTPDHRWIYLQDESKDKTIFMFQPNVFHAMRVIQLKVSQVKGIYWDEKKGKPFIVPVFQKRGTYELYFADNLGTEPDNTFFMDLKVKLVASKDK